MADYISVEYFRNIQEYWGKMPKAKIAKKLKISMKTLNEYAYSMANGMFGEEFELPKTKTYGPYDERSEIDIKVGKKSYPIRIPKYDWPKKKDDIQDEIDDTLSRVTSDVLFIGSVIHFAKERNLRKKREYLKEWQKVIDGVVALQELNC